MNCMNCMGGSESVAVLFLSVSTCVLCSSGLSDHCCGQQSLEAQTSQWWKCSRILAEEFKEG